MPIDWEALGVLEETAHGTRSAFPELSKRYVGGEGDNPLAFIIGEAPGAQEDAKQRPFVGSTGQILRQLMLLAALTTEDTVIDPSDFGQTDYPIDARIEANCWLTNTVKFRPPGNRTPNDLQVKAFRQLLRPEWEAVGKPRLIIPVGGIALYALTGKKISILRAAGKCHKYKSKEGIPLHIWPMMHPSFAARAGSHVQQLAEEDWERLGRWRFGGEGI